MRSVPDLKCLFIVSRHTSPAPYTYLNGISLATQLTGTQRRTYNLFGGSSKLHVLYDTGRPTSCTMQAAADD